MTDDRGSGSLLIVLVCCIVIAAAWLAATVAAVIAAHSRADAAADLAALAVADTIMVEQDPCRVGGRVAAANDARLVECHVRGATAEVSVATSLPAYLDRLAAGRQARATAAARLERDDQVPLR